MRYYTTIIILVAVFLSGCASLTGQHRRTAYVNGHPNVPVFYAQAIKDGAIMVGMTKDQVSASWGNPCGWCYGTRKSRWGDTWEYNVFGSSTMGIGNGHYVYFQNGRVVGWSN